MQASAFNGGSYPLTRDEALLFKNSKEVQSKLVEAYKMMLDFYGMRLLEQSSGEIARAKNTQLSQERYNSAIIRSLHNHLRISRILSCLNAVGLRRYAVELHSFIEKEIEQGDRPLRAIANVESRSYWRKYGAIDESNLDQVAMLEKATFLDL